MIGKKFNSWLILEDAPRDKWGSKHYRCRCDCGNEGIISQASLKRNHSSRCRSCGYKDKKKTVEITRLTTKGNNFQHGYCGTSTYGVWEKMKSRCNPECKGYKSPKSYPWYGAKGIRVCDKWMDFKNFLADMGEKPKGMQLDRIDGNGNYEPSNCRWATALENNRNRIWKKKHNSA